MPAGPDWVERQPAWIRSVLIRLDGVVCAALRASEELHRTASLFSSSSRHRKEAEQVSRYRRMSRGMRLGCLFISLISLAAACVVFWIVLD